MPFPKIRATFVSMDEVNIKCAGRVCQGFCLLIIGFVLEGCRQDENPSPALSGRMTTESKYQFRSTTDFLTNLTYQDSTFYFDAVTEKYYLGTTVDGSYAVSGDTLRFLNARIKYHFGGCTSTSGVYKQSSFTLFRVDEDSIYLNYNYILSPVNHSGETLPGRWEYSRSVTTRDDGATDDTQGIRFYYFEFSALDDEMYEFGWEDSFESCMKTNVRFNSYSFDPPLLDMTPVSVHPNLVVVEFHDGRMHWSDASGYAGYKFEAH